MSIAAKKCAQIFTPQVLRDFTQTLKRSEGQSGTLSRLFSSIMAIPGTEFGRTAKPVDIGKLEFIIKDTP